MFAALLASSCAVQHKVTVRGGDIHREYEVMRAAEAAEVEASRTTDGGDPETVRERMELDQTVVHGDKKYTVRALMHNCTSVIPFAEDTTSFSDCGLVKLREATFHVRTYEGRSASKFAWGAVGYGSLGLLLGSVTCALACDDGSALHTGSKYVLIGTGTVFGAWLTWELLQCFIGTRCGR